VKTQYNTCHTQNKSIFLPDIEIKEDKPEYVYVPLRGDSASLAVFNLDDRCIGWINSSNLGL
jgi:hypothetical protein